MGKHQALVNIVIPSGATGLKLAAYFPGCEYATLEIRLEDAGGEADLPCRVLGTRRLHGHIANMAALGDSPAEVHANLSTVWMCRFFEMADCMTPIIRVATAEVQNGEFILDVPDFGRQEGAGSVGFDQSLDQPVIQRTGTLAPVKGSRHTSGMMILPSFEADIVFEAVELRINGEVQPGGP